VGIADVGPEALLAIDRRVGPLHANVAHLDNELAVGAITRPQLCTPGSDDGRNHDASTRRDAGVKGGECCATKAVATYFCWRAVRVLQHHRQPAGGRPELNHAVCTDAAMTVAELGDEIRRVLLDPASDITPRAEALLFMASRAQLLETLVRPALAAGHVVLLDRFFLSTYAYQGAGRGLPEAEVRQANAVATSGLVPDVTLLLSLSVHEGLARAEKRGERDRMERNADDFHNRVAAAFAQFGTAAWQREHAECGPIVTVDASGSEDDVFARVRATVEAHGGDRWSPE